MNQKKKKKKKKVRIKLTYIFVELMQKKFHYEEKYHDEHLHVIVTQHWFLMYDNSWMQHVL